MTTTLPELNISGDVYTLKTWAKGEHERAYITSPGGKEYGYWDLKAGAYVHTGKSFASRSWKEIFEASVNAWGKTVAVTVPVETNKPVAVTHIIDPYANTQERADLMRYARKNLDYNRTELDLMDTETMSNRVMHDL